MTAIRKTILSGVAAIFAVVLLLGGCDRPKPDLRGRLVVETLPEGATLFADGKELDVTPSSFNGPPGTYLLRLEKPGFAPVWHYAEVKTGETSELKLNLPETGSPVLVNSRPAAAEVRLNGELLGSTPLVLPHQQPGEYSLQVLKPGFAERQVKFTVENRRPQEVMVTLDSNIGRLALDSEPSQAKLWLNGREVGYTPYNVELDEGRYEIKLEKTGFAVLEGFVIVNRDQQTKKTLLLSGLPGTLAVTSDPAGASVYLDDEMIGVTPLERPDIASGNRQIILKKTGFDDLADQIDVAAGARVEYNAALTRSTGGIDITVSPVGVKVFINDKEYGIVETDPNSSLPKMISLRNLSPGLYKVTAVHRRATPERVSVTVKVNKGEIARPKALELWVPNAEVKWRATGLVEIGMLYAETDTTIIFGAERGVKIPYKRSEFEYIKKLNLDE